MLHIVQAVPETSPAKEAAQQGDELLHFYQPHESEEDGVQDPASQHLLESGCRVGAGRSRVEHADGIARPIAITARRERFDDPSSPLLAQRARANLLLLEPGQST